MTLDPEQQELAIRNAKLAQLETPFPAEAIGKLPKGGVELDFVGHAAVTKRLLQVDPAWSWEPVGTTDHGLPLFDSANGLWIRLTICGVTRLGYGDGSSVKECIGDAIRNAAMRFGVALNLWAREDLSGIGTHGPDGAGADAPSVVAATAPAERPSDDGEASGGKGDGGKEAAPSGDASNPPAPAHEWIPSPRPKLAEQGWVICSVKDCPDHMPHQEKAKTSA